MKTFFIIIFIALVSNTSPKVPMVELETEITALEIGFPGTCKRKRKDLCIVNHAAYRNREWIPGDIQTFE